MFKTVKPSRIFQDVVEQIENAIISGELIPGEKLPPERELKETFAISRGTLREALRVLEQKRLIDIQLGAGGGAIVREITSEPMTDSLSLLLRSQKIPLDDLKEFRMDMEGTIARLAADRAGVDDVEALREILASAKECLDSHAGWEAYVQADAQLHMRLAQITGNPIYAYVQTAIHENITLYYAEFLEHEERVLREHYKDLCRLVDAVAAGDGRQAFEQMQRHLGRLGSKRLKQEEGNP